MADEPIDKGTSESERAEIPEASPAKKAARAGMQIAGGAVPFVGGVLSAAAGAWSEHEQDQINKVFRQWLEMLEDELREKGKTIFEIMARLEMQDEKIRERIESPEYKSILKKAFRNWSSIDSESKRQKVRNILSNAAATDLVMDDVVRMFLDWLDSYSDFHFEVIGEIYRNAPISRGQIWHNLSRPDVREDSAEADLFKLLIRDLSTGGVIRQERAVDAYGSFLKEGRSSRGRSSRGRSDDRMTSAFDDEKAYILTELGNQFVHYAMNELAPRITFDGFEKQKAETDR